MSENSTHPSGPLRLAIDLTNPDPEILAQAAEVIRGGGVVAYPTEHFYALGCDPFNPAAVQALFALKNRTLDKPVLLAIGQRDSLDELVRAVPRSAEVLLDEWPNGLTLLFVAAAAVVPGIKSKTGRVGVRLVPVPLVTKLIDLCAGGAITATSANRSGEDASGNPDTVAQSLPGVDLLLDAGPLCPGRPSTLLDVSGSVWRIIREGAASAQNLSAYGRVLPFAAST